MAGVVESGDYRYSSSSTDRVSIIDEKRSIDRAQNEIRACEAWFYSFLNYI